MSFLLIKIELTIIFKLNIQLFFILKPIIKKCLYRISFLLFFSIIVLIKLVMKSIKYLLKKTPIKILLFIYLIFMFGINIQYQTK